VMAASWALSRLQTSHPAAVNTAVRMAAAAVIGASFALMLWNTFRHGRGDIGGGVAAPPARLPLKAVPFGALLGVLMGATSIGGGIFMLPGLMAWFHLAPRHAVGTSTLISLVAAFFGSLVFHQAGDLEWGVAVAMFAGSLPGVWLGARIATRLPAAVLRACVLAAMALATAMLLLGR